MKLSEIEEVARVVKDGPDYGLIESEVIQGISMLPVGSELYTADQMQEYAKAKVLETVELYAKDGSTVPVDFIKEFVLKIIFEEDTKND
ncbi:hypothetical protein [Lactococcus lactis]|uniref:hypothetical protein n=1 Tax=Lactococcus lactis TaxID=1358 RepID=UPI00223AAB59|nr:hypothetical protein [Lactococcus lactis]MCT1172355.1 hypothetical protein [Lactococcus lactis]